MVIFHGYVNHNQRVSISIPLNQHQSLQSRARHGRSHDISPGAILRDQRRHYRRWDGWDDLGKLWRMWFFLDHLKRFDDFEAWTISNVGGYRIITLW